MSYPGLQKCSWFILQFKPTGPKWFQVFLYITNNSIKRQSFAYTHLNNQAVLFQTIQFSILFVCTQFNFIWLSVRTLSSATTLGQSAPGSKGNEGVLWIPQSSCLTEASLSVFFNVINRTLIEEVLSLYRYAVGVFYIPWQLSQIWFYGLPWCIICYK